jgi:hypothetical protein
MTYLSRPPTPAAAAAAAAAPSFNKLFILLFYYHRFVFLTNIRFHCILTNTQTLAIVADFT